MFGTDDLTSWPEGTRVSPTISMVAVSDDWTCWIDGGGGRAELGVGVARWAGGLFWLRQRVFSFGGELHLGIRGGLAFDGETLIGTNEVQSGAAKVILVSEAASLRRRTLDRG